MDKVFKNLSHKAMIVEVVPAFGISLLMAEFFYKFGSFAIECIAFLATWYFIGRTINILRDIFQSRL